METLSVPLQSRAEAFPRRDGVLFCEDVPIPELVARWGTPLYVYSRSAIQERFRELDEALAPVPHLIAYSVRANGNLSVLRTLADQGAAANVVSAGELHRARLAGIPGARIVFSGVGKTVGELAAALDAGVYAINVESEGELAALSDLARATGRRAPVALRVNVSSAAPTPHAYARTAHAATKFGIAAERARDLYCVAAKLPGIRVCGVDVHLGSQILEVEPYRRALEQVLDLAQGLKREGLPLEFIDLGGGLGISYTGEEGISPAEFAGVVIPQLEGTGLTLLVEPGRFLVGHAGVLITRVLYVKEGGGKRFVITDAGMNDLLRPSHFAGWHGVDAVRLNGRASIRADIVGPLYEAGDFLALDREIERPEPGELLAVRTVGAYGFSMSSTYNQRPRSAEVMVEGSEAKLVRRRETLDDLVAAELDLGYESRIAADYALAVAQRTGDVRVLVERTRQRLQRAHSGGLDEALRQADTVRAGAGPQGPGPEIDRQALAGTAHRLSNVLYRIETYAHLLGDLLPDEPTFREIAREIQAFADQGKMDVKALTSIPDPLRVLVPLAGVIRRAFRLAEDHGIEVTYQLPDALPPVIGDEWQLTGCFTELARNATHWLAPAGGRVRIVARLLESGTAPRGLLHDSGYLQVVVQDNGPGVRPDMKETIFHEGFTIRPGGTGIGLAEVKRTILTHGGIISEAGTYGKGARFEIVLPCASTHRDVR